MKFPKYRKRYARKATKKTKKSYPRKNFVKSVKKIVHGMAENKTIINATALTDVVPMSAAQYTSLNLIPNSVLQGAPNNQRIGNQITLVSNYLRMYFTLKPYVLGTNPFQSPVQVCLWVYSFKTANAFSIQAATVQDLVSNNLFQSNNTSVGTQKTVQDLLFAPNNEIITVHKKVMFTLNTPTSAASSTGFNSDGHPYKFINLNLSKYVKKITYNDTAAGPTNKNLYMLINTYHTDGTVYTDAERMVAYTSVQTWKFEDF